MSLPSSLLAPATTLSGLSDVLSVCVTDPSTVLDLDLDLFAAWCRGITVREVVAELAGALSMQYELNSAGGSGYATVAANIARIEAARTADNDEEKEATADSDDAFLRPIPYDAAPSSSSSDDIHRSSSMPHHPPPLLPPPSALDLLSHRLSHSRLLSCWQSDLDSQYRLFSILEHSLKKPFLLHVRFCPLQLAFRHQLELVQTYYAFDTSFMRIVVGQKLNKLAKGNMELIVDKMKAMQSQQQLQSMQREEVRRRNSLSIVSTSGASTSKNDANNNDASASLYAASSDSLPSAASSLSSSDVARFSSICRQYDNLRRIYRCRWGEKGDGVMGETEIDLDPDAAAVASGGAWKNMRAAAVAYGQAHIASYRKDNAISTSSSSASASPAILHQSFSQSSSSSISSTSPSSLDDLFGFAPSQQPIRSEQTLAQFIRCQFRLDPSLARAYARMVFLAHNRLEPPTVPKNSQEVGFNEIELIAQIMMRCWTTQVGSQQSASASWIGEEKEKDSISESHHRTQSAAVYPPQHRMDAIGSIYGAPPSTSVSSSATSFSFPLKDLTSTPTSYDEDDDDCEGPSGPSASACGAAAAGYEFLPLVAQIHESDEDTWVGDALDMEFINGVRRKR